jgi:N-acetylneuraminate synthase
MVNCSCHETGLVETAVVVSMGSKIIECHMTLNRSVLDTDQTAFIEPQGLTSLIKYIRTVEKVMGDGKKK